MLVKQQKDEYKERTKPQNEPPVRLKPFQRNARLWMSAWLLTSDLFSLLLSFALAFVLRLALPGGLNSTAFLELLPFLILCPMIYAWRGLYPAVGMSPVDELRLLFGSTTSFFFLFMTFTFITKSGESFSRLMVGFAWLIALVLVQVSRWFFRILLRNAGMWGEPIAIIGSGPETDRVAEHLRRRLHLGLLPAIKIASERSLDDRLLAQIARKRIETAILILREMPEELREFIIDHKNLGLKRLILISSMGWVGSLGVTPLDMEGVLGLELRQNLSNAWHQGLKRSMDLLLATTGLVALSPLLVLLTILIKLDSPGKAFFTQKRIGKQGQVFKIWKFRTMVANAEQVLHDHLERDPALKAEWVAAQKLKNDPRITRVGKTLRKWSLDELPQLFNVFLGEMSLVGPRPIAGGAESESVLYGRVFGQYKMVRPGMTGLWQISGRSNQTYQERVHLDEYYIGNWSLWLDVYILLRTIGVVISRDGAY